MSIISSNCSRVRSGAIFRRMGRDLPSSVLISCKRPSNRCSELLFLQFPQVGCIGAADIYRKVINNIVQFRKQVS